MAWLDNLLLACLGKLLLSVSFVFRFVALSPLRIEICWFFFQNEEILKKATTDYQEKLKRSEEKYRMLKKHAEEKIERFCSVLFVRH